MTFIFLLSLICLSIFESKLRNSPYYDQVEALRRGGLTENVPNKKERLKDVVSKVIN